MDPFFNPYVNPLVTRVKRLLVTVDVIQLSVQNCCFISRFSKSWGYLNSPWSFQYSVMVVHDRS